MTGAGPNGPTLGMPWNRPLEVGTIALRFFTYAGTDATQVVEVTDDGGNVWRRLGGGVATGESRCLEVWGAVATAQVASGFTSDFEVKTTISAWTIFGAQFVGGRAGLVVEAFTFQDFLGSDTPEVVVPTEHDGDLLLGAIFGWSVGLPGDLFAWLLDDFEYLHGYEGVLQVAEFSRQATADAGTVVGFDPFTSQDFGLLGFAILEDYTEVTGDAAGSLALAGSGAAGVQVDAQGTGSLALAGAGTGAVGDAPIIGIGSGSLALEGQGRAWSLSRAPGPDPSPWTAPPPGRWPWPGRGAERSVWRAPGLPWSTSRGSEVGPWPSRGPGAGPSGIPRLRGRGLGCSRSWAPPRALCRWPGVARQA